MAFPVADLTRREIPRGCWSGVGVPPGYGAGRGQLAAHALAGGAAGDAALAGSPLEPGAEAAQKASADPALPLAGCDRCACASGCAHGSAPPARRAESPLRTHPGDPQAREKALAQLHAGIDRASRLVDQLLTLSRLDSLDNLDDVEPITLADLLQSAVLDIWHPAQQAGIDIRLFNHAPQVKRQGQPLLLSLLVRNLLDNAIRYSPRGSVVDVTLDARSFSVRDNGPGVDPEVLARIGERFYRPPGQNATGSGLGLSIVRRIAALHGMHVSLSNAAEGGFEVKVSW